MNQGDDWTAISDDLTQGGKDGNVAYGTITAISESPFAFGLIYTGSDDGKIFVTKNGGAIWEDVSTSLPQDLWVSRIVASAHKKERVYATLNGYRWDDFTTYIYVSENFGQTWKSISSGIPPSPVNVIVEDPKKENIIYVGTDNGAYVSMNGGGEYHAFAKAQSGDTTTPFPAVAVHDMKIQKQANHLLLGTHGRSIYRADITSIQELDISKNQQLFKIDDIKHSLRWGTRFNTWRAVYEPEVQLSYYVNKKQPYTLTVQSEKGKTLTQIPLQSNVGLNVVNYDLSITDKGKKALEKEVDTLDLKRASNQKYYLPKGTYYLVLSSNTEKEIARSNFTIN